MRIEEWESRYASGERSEDRAVAPTPLVTETASKLAPGRVLDLACGSGRNAFWLAEQGWKVTAVDGSRTAIDMLKKRAESSGFELDAKVANLEDSDFIIVPGSYDLILDCYYLQRSLFSALKAGLTPGGITVAIVHISKPDEEATYKHAAPGELRGFFADWEILHYFEGPPDDPSHKRDVAEIVARKPISLS